MFKRRAKGGASVRPDQPPLVSLVLCTRRPEFLNHAVSQVMRQTYPEIELVLVAHGSGFPPTEAIELQYPRPMTVVRVPSSIQFGDALNRGVLAASGSLIAKMDDDDWYSGSHIANLVRVLQDTRVDLVGKGAEFVYLEELDITIRRMSSGVHNYNNRNIAGGTLLVRKSTLQRVGGWQNIPRHVDQALLDDIADHGGTWYRTDGYGYVLHRRSSGHTWDTEIDYFLDQSEQQYRGLALNIAIPDG